MKTFEFYGVDGNYYKLDDVVWQAIEDEGDGYRSYLGSIEKVDDSSHIFFGNSLATVRIEEVKDAGDFEGFRIIDVEDGHVWLEVGTYHYDEYYPCFTFDYHPKQNKNIDTQVSKEEDEWRKFLG